MSDFRLTVDLAPQRVVSLQPSATATLARLGMLDHVVACTKWCVEVCPEVADTRAIIADSWSAQAEQILAARPELVIASVPYQAEAVAQILKAGARFLGLAPKTLADVYGDIAAIAGVMQVNARGEAVVREIQEEIEAVRATALRSAARPRVFCEEWGKPIMRSQPWVAELVEAAGGEFLGDPGQPTDADWVRHADPDALVCAWCGAGDRVPLEKILEQRAWNHTRAARDGRVFALRDELLNTPGPTLVDGLHALASVLHPELFPAHKGVRRIGSPVLK